MSTLPKDVLPAAGIKLVLVQRSCGYALRPTLGISEIAKVVELVRRCGPPGCVVAVDNCYGEMTDVLEPCAVRPSLASLFNDHCALSLDQECETGSSCMHDIPLQSSSDADHLAHLLVMFCAAAKQGSGLEATCPPISHLISSVSSARQALCLLVSGCVQISAACCICKGLEDTMATRDSSMACCTDLMFPASPMQLCPSCIHLCSVPPNCDGSMLDWLLTVGVVGGCRCGNG